MAVIDHQADEPIDDLLVDIFRMQEKLMKRYQSETTEELPDWPLELTCKSDQRFCRDMISRMQDELFEAKFHLRRAKEHRNVDCGDLDFDALTEELVDSLHYFVEVMILLGVSPHQLYDLYNNKNSKNHKRIDKEFGCSAI